MLYQSDSRSAVQSEPKHSHLTFMWSEVSWYPPRLPSHGNCSRHDRFGSRTAQLRARWSACVAQPSAVRLRWTQRCARGAGASSGCYVDVAWASTGAVSDTNKLPPNAPTARTYQHAHGRDSTRCGAWTFTRTPEHQSVGASGSADGKHSFSTTRRSITGPIWCAARELQPSRPVR